MIDLVSSSPLTLPFEKESLIHAKLVAAWWILRVLGEIVQQQR
jgi:hypothetical protein